MKKFFSSIATIALLSFCVSCSNDGIDSGNGNYGSQAAENGSVYWQGDEDRLYTHAGVLRVYMAGEAVKSINSIIKKVMDDIVFACSQPEVPDPQRCEFAAEWYAKQPPNMVDDEGRFTQAINEGRALYILNKMLTTIALLEVGTISNGIVFLALPQEVEPPRLSIEYLEGIELSDNQLAGYAIKEGVIYAEYPLLAAKQYAADKSDAEAWFNTEPLRIIDNSGKHIGNLRYYKKAGDTEHFVHYWYFPGDVKLNEGEYRIDAKKGWNKVYARTKQSGESYYTTDLREVPAGLKWLVEELAD